MAGTLDDFPLATDEKPAAVVGAPEPGGGVPVPAVGGTWHPETRTWEVLKGQGQVGEAAPAPAAALEDFPIAEDPHHPTPSETEIKASGQPATADMGEAPAFWQAFISKPWVIGKPAGEFTDYLSRKVRAKTHGISEEQARKEIEILKADTEKGHSTATAIGGFLGSANALVAAATQFPRTFGVAAASPYVENMAAGGATNVAMKLVDNYLRNKPFDPVDVGVAGGAGVIGGAFSTYLNRAFSAAVDPVVADLARWGIQNKIPVQAGWVSNNSFIKKVPGELFAAGEKILPAGAKAKEAEKAALDAWHRRIAEMIGSDADRVTSKVLADTRKAIEAEGKQLTAAARQNGGALPQDLRAQGDALFERAKNVRIMEDVVKVNGNGQFTPEEFYLAVREAVDRLAKDASEEFAYDGGGELTKAAKFGAAFLKTASHPAIDQHLGVEFLKKAAWSLATGAVPGVAHFVHGGGVTPAGITGAVVAGVTGLGKLIASHIAGAASRSPGIANELLRQSAPLGVPAAHLLVKPAAGLVAKSVPGLIQQALPLGDKYIQSFGQPIQ